MHHRSTVYDLDNSEVEKLVHVLTAQPTKKTNDGMFVSQVPILHDVRDITLAKSGSEALVSYENKVSD